MSLAIVAAIHGGVFAVAAIVLPWKTTTVITAMGLCLATLHAATAVAAIFARTWLPQLWKGLAIASLFVLASGTWAIAASAYRLIELYQGIGTAVTAGLLLFWGWLVLFTVPFAWWGLASVPRGAGSSRAKTGIAVSALVLVAIVLSSFSPRAGRALHVAAVREANVRSALDRMVAQAELRDLPSLRPSSFHDAPIACSTPVSDREATLLVTHPQANGEMSSTCITASTLSAAMKRLAAVVSGVKALPVKVDVVRAIAPLPTEASALEPFLVRPAADGVCAETRCFAPWQLVALDAFVQFQALDAVKDARFGVSLDHLRLALGVSEGAQLWRIETLSYVIDGAGVHELRRLRSPEKPVTRETLRQAIALAEQHIVAAQLRDGKFRYTLDPYRGSVETASLNLPRQAGTLLALCEVGSSGRLRFVARRAAAQLASFALASDDSSLITDNPHVARLGSTALPLVALASCRDILGDGHDPLIARLSRFLLTMQRPDGSFHPEFDVASKSPGGSGEALYAAGQAVMGLVLVEKLAATSGLPGLDAATVRGAVTRAMHYYAEDYWPAPLSDFFYLEENWHCLAARAALAVHRDDRYERFCLDYAGFKSRLILESEAEGDPSFEGGYGLGTLFPPHNTATAGFGETSSAAIAVRRARGMDVTHERALLRKVLAFLLRAQWDDTNCFACSRGHRVIGGFSEHFASPIIRIDYVQHAMAALGHGARALGLEDG